MFISYLEKCLYIKAGKPNKYPYNVSVESQAEDGTRPEANVAVPQKIVNIKMDKNRGMREKDRRLLNWEVLNQYEDNLTGDNTDTDDKKEGEKN